MASAKTQSIFKAAIDVFSERGFEKATMDEIAARAHVAKGTIYYHFKSKEELFSFLVQEGTKLLHESVLSKVNPRKTPTEQIETIIREQLRFFDHYRDFCVILLREAWGDDVRQREFRRMLVHYVHAIEQIMRAGIESEEFLYTKAETGAWSIFGSISMAALHHIFSEPDMDLLLLAPDLTRMILKGMVSQITIDAESLVDEAPRKAQ